MNIVVQPPHVRILRTPEEIKAAYDRQEGVVMTSTRATKTQAPRSVASRLDTATEGGSRG